MPSSAHSKTSSLTVLATSAAFSSTSEARYAQSMITDPASVAVQLAQSYHKALPERILDYLINERGISHRDIEFSLLGWNGTRITIPVWDRDGKLAFFKLAKDPADASDSPKMLTPAGASAELYAWDRVRLKPFQLIICEGEFDRLVLETHGFPAVTSTAGAAVFRPDWAPEFQGIREIYICYDRDQAGRLGALRVARLLPYAKVVELPVEVGDGGDVTNFFVRLRHTREDFAELLKAAKPMPPSELALPDRRTGEPRGQGDTEVARLKASVTIEHVIGQSVSLRPSGENFTGRCPFHEDHTPSFVVFPKTQSFYCFGCQAQGDVLTYLMRRDNLIFPEALDVLRRFAAEAQT